VLCLPEDLGDTRRFLAGPGKVTAQQTAIQAARIVL
jgi:hypothetical protein